MARPLSCCVLKAPQSRAWSLGGWSSQLCKNHDQVLVETVSAAGGQWWWVMVGTILPQKQILEKTRSERLCLWTVLSAEMAAFSFCQTASVFYEKSRFEYLKSEKTSSATGNNAMIQLFHYYWALKGNWMRVLIHWAIFQDKLCYKEVI